MITSNPNRTHDRYITLRRYLRQQVLDSHDHFICPHRRACKASHSGPFHPAQLHHVGRHYDLAVDGQQLRVVVVGQEYGHGPGRVTMAERRRRISRRSARQKRFFADEHREGRNPHMRGTTSALRLLHGRKPGSDYEGEWLDLASGRRAHLFDTFALVNYLLCSAVADGSTRGLATREMKRNCAEHFREALDILSPTVVVIQGTGFARWVVKQLPAYRPRKGVLGRAEFPEGPATVVSLSHPAAAGPTNWGDLKRPYLREVVAPALRAARPLPARGRFATR